MYNKTYSDSIKDAIVDILDNTPHVIYLYLGDLPYVVYLNGTSDIWAHIFELDPDKDDFSVKKPPSTRPHYRHDSVVYKHAIFTITDTDHVRQIKSLKSTHHYLPKYRADGVLILSTHIDAHTSEYDLMMSIIAPMLKEKVDAHKETIRKSKLIIDRERKRIKSHTDEIDHITTILNEYKKKDKDYE